MYGQWLIFVSDRHATLRNTTTVTANCFNWKRSKTKFTTFKDTKKFTCREKKAARQILIFVLRYTIQIEARAFFSYLYLSLVVSLWNKCSHPHTSGFAALFFLTYRVVVLYYFQTIKSYCNRRYTFLMSLRSIDTHLQNRTYITTIFNVLFSLR